jgi:tetratricopeptide (TPR) repeat protein
MSKGIQTRPGLLRVILTVLAFIAGSVVSVNGVDAQDPIKVLGSKPQPANQSTAELDPALADAKSMVEQGNANGAERFVREYLKTRPDSADGHFLLGYILFRQLQQSALENAFSGERNGAHGSDARIPTANLKDEKVRASLAEYTEGAKHRDPSAFDLKIVALDYVLLGDYVDADKWLTRMLEWAPNDADGWYYLGRTKYNEGRYAEAVRAFEQCLKLNPQNVRAEDNLGLSYAGLGRTEEAIAAYKNAIEWQRNAATKDAGPHIDMGSVLLDLDRTEESITYLQQSISISPEDPRAHELLGKAYARLNRHELAQGELETAIHLDPKNPHLPCMLGPVYRKRGMMEQAQMQLERCAALNGTPSTR